MVVCAVHMQSWAVMGFACYDRCSYVGALSALLFRFVLTAIRPTTTHPPLADELLEQFLESFPEETAAVQLQLMTATVKLFLKKPVEKPQQLIQLVLTYATQVGARGGGSPRVGSSGARIVRWTTPDLACWGSEHGGNVAYLRLHCSIKLRLALLRQF